jgi:hypothetical protein
VIGRVADDVFKVNGVALVPPLACTLARNAREWKQHAALRDRFAEGASARRAQSGPRIGVRDWTLPCCSHESRAGVTFPVGRRPSGCGRRFFP